MNIEELEKFNSWCLTKVKLSQGTTSMYIKYLINTPNYNINTKYETMHKIIISRINTNPERYAHLGFIKYLIDQTSNRKDKQKLYLIYHDIKQLKINNRSRHRPDDIFYKIFTKNEIEKIYQFAYKQKLEMFYKLHDLLFFRYLYESAGRIEEVRNYTFDMINMDEMIINVDRKITKRNKARTAELSKKTIELTKIYYEILPIELRKDRIFFNLSNYASANRFIQKITHDSIKKRATAHWFRHSFLTHKTVDAINSGEHISIVKEKLRAYVNHSNINTTEIYIKLAMNMKRDRILEQYGQVP